MRSALVIASTILVLASGCLGGNGEPQADPSTSPTLVVDTALPDPSPTPTEPPVYNPYHGHDYWGGRPSVVLFADDVSIGQVPEKETYFDPQRMALVVGKTEFNTQQDGDDSRSTDKADVVYPGTGALVLQISWEDTTENVVPGLTFYYKPAHTPMFTAIPNIQNGQEYAIPLGKGWADMAHQLEYSRWRFMIEAYDPAASSSPMKTFVARGTVDILITALNGGDSSLDPPHPFNYVDADEVFAGEVDEPVDAVVVQGPAGAHTQGTPLRGWKVPAPYFIPWETTTVRAWLYYNYTGEADGVPHDVGLTYSDSSGPELKRPSVVEQQGDAAYYEIEVAPNEADDPYATQSDWTWGVYPIVNGTPEYGGDVKGDVHIVLVATGTSPTGGM